MKSFRNLQSLLMGAAGVVAVTGVAQAAPQEYSLLLLDRTGSMSEVTNSATNSTRWTDAMDAAISVIQAKDYDHFVDRAYAIWDFRIGAGTVGGPTNDTSQVTAKQVWPLTAADCTSLCTNCATFVSVASSAGTTNNYCDFGSSGADAPYDALIALLNKYKTDPDRTPDVNGNGRTPLADSLCLVLDQLRLANTNLAQTITFESDGLENQSSSTGVCGNFAAASTAVPYSTDPSSVWTKSAADWGMSAAAGSGAPDALDSTLFPGGGSWEARVVRRGLRLTTPSSVTATGKAILANEVAATNLAWRVHAHYTTYSNTTTSPMLLSVAPTASTTSSVSGNSDLPTVAPRFAVSAFAAGLAPTATTTAATTATVTLSIPQAELSLFRQLGSPSFPSKGTGASRSFFGAVTLAPGQTYGTYHKLPGDVDDSGCTDRADYNMVMQKDVWRQRAVQPNQIAIRADLSKDGWVNEADRTIVLSHWGQGCINNPGPAPKP